MQPAQAVSHASTSAVRQQSPTQQQYELDACPVLLSMIRSLALQVN